MEASGKKSDDVFADDISTDEIIGAFVVVIVISGNISKLSVLGSITKLGTLLPLLNSEKLTCSSVNTTFEVLNTFSV